MVKYFKINHSFDMIHLYINCDVLDDWLTENIFNSLSRQGSQKGAEEGANEGVLQECRVLERVGGVQLETGNCREQIGKEIHPWNLSLIQIIIANFPNKWCDVMDDVFTVQCCSVKPDGRDPV